MRGMVRRELSPLDRARGAGLNHLSLLGALPSSYIVYVPA